MQIIIVSTILVAVLGLLIGLFLGVASEIFKVKVDEKIAKIREVLPGNNCGGCGYPGCDGLAEAIAKGEAPINGCPVGGSVVAKKVSEIMGVKEMTADKKIAFVHCNGNCDNANLAYEYFGEKSCRVVSMLPNRGEKKCRFACIGFGECVEACKFDAIHIVNGVAKVDAEKCVACSACIKACPMNLIELVPYGKKHLVVCSSKDKGKTVMDACKVSCIACGMCEKNCESDAIHVIDNLAKMDFIKCTDCGICSEKCPRKTIS